jgi:hypothetical protein
VGLPADCGDGFPRSNLDSQNGNAVRTFLLSPLTPPLTSAQTNKN